MERPGKGIVDAIEDDIIFGVLAPGARLTEDSLLARFGGTRHAIRQALVEMEQAGIVRRERNVGATVRRYQPGEVLELHAVREMLQREAALLIPHPAPPGLTDTLEALDTRFWAAQKAGDLRAVHEANDAFHLALFGACGNRRLLGSIRGHMALSLPMRATSLADPVAFAASKGQHGIMIRLLERADRWTLAQLCTDHVQPSKQACLEQVSAQARVA